MANDRNTEREEPQRTSTDEERVRGVAEQDDDFDEDDDLEDEDSDEEGGTA